MRTTGATVVAIIALTIAVSPQTPPGVPPVLRAGVDAIVVPVIVRDGNGPVRGLSASDFELLDNNVLQNIGLAATESRPIDVTLVLDTSLSVRGRSLDEFKNDVAVIAESLRTNDRVRLLTFATSVTDLTGLQPGGPALPLRAIAAGGGTALYNAIAAALTAFPVVDRPQLVYAFSDGIDNMSYLDAHAVDVVAKHTSAALYLSVVKRQQDPLLPDAPGGPASRVMLTPYEGGPDLRALRQIVADTGGVFDEPRLGTGIPAAFLRALDDFRQSYVLTYAPKGVSPVGRHSLTVRVRGRRVMVRARPDYDAG